MIWPAGKIDVGLIWGPLGGYWAERQAQPIALTLLPSDRREGLQMDFRVSLGIRPNEPDWKHELDAALRELEPEIEAILAEYHVPQLDNRGQLIDPATVRRAEQTMPPPSMVPEPPSYRTENYRAPVPNTLKGATVLDGAALEKLEVLAAPVLVDVLARQPRPANRPEGSIWIEPSHQTIEGSVWLPNVGYGYLPAETMRYFADSLAALTEGDATRPLVFFCAPDCWMSWNAAKRAVDELGYKNVYWLPAGADAWAARGHELVEARVFRPEQAGLAQ